MSKIMNTKLSPKEEIVYKFIKKSVRKNGYAPTRQEIADELGVEKHGRSYVHRVLENMEMKGYVSLGKGWRNITPIIK